MARLPVHLATVLVLYLHPHGGEVIILDINLKHGGWCDATQKNTRSLWSRDTHQNVSLQPSKWYKPRHLLFVIVIYCMGNCGGGECKMVSNRNGCTELLNTMQGPELRRALPVTIVTPIVRLRWHEAGITRAGKRMNECFIQWGCPVARLQSSSHFMLRRTGGKGAGRECNCMQSQCEKATFHASGFGFQGCKKKKEKAQLDSWW